jgi:plasmid stability protein
LENSALASHKQRNERNDRNIITGMLLSKDRGMKNRLAITCLERMTAHVGIKGFVAIRVWNQKIERCIGKKYIRNDVFGEIRHGLETKITCSNTGTQTFQSRVRIPHSNYSNVNLSERG